MKIWNKLQQEKNYAHHKRTKKNVPLRVRKMRHSGKCIDVTALLTNKVQQG